MFDTRTIPRRQPRCTARQYEWRLRQVQKRLWGAHSSAEVVRWAMRRLGISRRMAQLYVRRARLPRPGPDLVTQTLVFLHEQLSRELSLARANERTAARVPARRVRRLRKCFAAQAPVSP